MVYQAVVRLDTPSPIKVGQGNPRRDGSQKQTTESETAPIPSVGTSIKIKASYTTVMRAEGLGWPHAVSQIVSTVSVSP